MRPATRRPVTFDSVRRMALALPGVEESTMYGAPAFRIRGHMFACQPSHRSAEPNSLLVVVDFDRRDELLAAEPDTYYTKEHYQNYPSVLVRLSRVHPDALRDFLQIAYGIAAAKPKKKSKVSRRR